MPGPGAHEHRFVVNSFFQRWNFIERARLERQLWDAFERGEDLDALVAECRSAVERDAVEGGAVEGGAGQRSFQLEVWTTTLARIRKIEHLMRDQRQPGRQDGQNPEG